MNSLFAESQPGVQSLGNIRDYVNEFINAVHNGSLLDGFSRREILSLSEYLECFGVPRCSTVLCEGDKGDFMTILVTGGAVITKAYDGIDKVVYVVKPGDIIGEFSMLDGQERFASCITTLPSDFAVLTQDKFMALMSDHPRLGNKVLLALLHTATGRLRCATQEMVPGPANFGFV